jgi:hypothetical protein
MAKKFVDRETGDTVTVVGPPTPSGNILIQRPNNGPLDVVPVDQLRSVSDDA